MKRLQHALTVLCLAASVPSCAAILGDDFTVSEDDDDDGGNGSDSGQTSGSTTGGCNQNECVACTEQQCSSQLGYCVDTDCLSWEDCMNGVDADCDPTECDLCYPGADEAHYQLGSCICATCNGSCCLSGC